MVLSAESITLNELQKKLAINGSVQGDFIQTKKMEIFTNPLVSKGVFVVDQNTGIKWEQQTPFFISLDLRKDTLTQKVEGSLDKVIKATDNPTIFYFTRLFLSIFQGDIEKLKDDFNISLKEKEGDWSLTLTPISSPLNKIFSKILIEGAAYTTHILLIEKSADTTDLLFLNQTSYKGSI